MYEKCEYCEIEKDEWIYRELPSKGGSIGLFLESAGGKWFHLEASTDDDTNFIEINYCPMCGRDLNYYE